jgi:ribonuclease-3
MAARKTGDTSELTQKLGHRFDKPQLLTDALTHPSIAGSRKKGGTAYERLEFLGDRVLGLIIAEWLYEKFPTESEGNLAKRHAALVNAEMLRVIATEIGLAQHVRLAKGEEAEAPRKNRATLPDAMEAVIGALYLDGGIEAAAKFIHRYWQKDVAVEAAPADPKTALQEWAQGQGLPLPSYKIVAKSGPAHAPLFTVEAGVKGHAPITAEGQSRRDAEKAAAALLLQSVTGHA